MKRTLVILHPGALGDILLSVPAIRRIEQAYPHHQKLLIGRGLIGQLLVECGVVDSWVDLDGQDGGGLFSNSTALSERLQAWLERCDLAVAWTEDQDEVLASTLRRCGVKETRIQSPFSTEVQATHQSDRFLETAGVPMIASSTAMLEVPPHLKEQGRSYLKGKGIRIDQPLIVVHPGSGSIHKCLNPELLVSMIESFVQVGIRPLVLEGPADREMVERLLKCTGLTLPVLMQPDLLVLAGLLVCATAYIGHDSGVTHLSALLGVRTIALFGPTDPNRWAPCGSHVTVLCGEPCTCAAWEMVKKCLEKPCLKVQAEKILDVLGLNAKV